MEQVAVLCTCGREIEPRHCPGCGRKDVYSIRRADRIVNIEGTKFKLKGFRCRNCGVEFDESTKCEAPERGLSMKERRRVDKVIDTTFANLTDLSPEERQAKLKILFASAQARHDAKSSDKPAEDLRRGESTEDFVERNPVFNDNPFSNVKKREAESSVSLDKEDGETQIVEEKKK